MRTTNSLIALAIAGAATAALVACPAAQLTPQEREHETMQRVAVTLDHGHVSGRRLDDTISERAMKAYLEALDPLKLYFLQSDVDRLAPYDDRLDDLVEAGDPSFAQRVFELYLQRLDERVALAKELLGSKLDFGVEESFVTDPKERHYARDESEARDLWRRRIKLDLLTLEASGTDLAKAKDLVRRRYEQLSKSMHELREDEVVSLFLSSVAGSFDPHTAYLSPRVLEDFEIQIRLNYQGIGARLKEEDGYAVVAGIMPGGAAEKDGHLAAGDKIVGVGGATGPLEDVVGMRLSDVVERVRGAEGTVVRLRILPAAGGPESVLSLTRARTELEDQTAHGEVMKVAATDGRKGARIGVIELPGFYKSDLRSSTGDVARLLRQFKHDGVDAVVLDLRYNGGGLLSEAVGVTGLFIDRGPVVMVRDSGGHVMSQQDEDRGAAWDGPLVVLTSRFSASASEIFAGAIKDYHRGLVVGDPSTHGKGTVQQVLDLGPPSEKLGALKLTVQQFYRPSGLSTQERGVRADVELPSLTAELSRGEAGLPYALAFDRIRGVPHADYGMVDPQIVKQISEASRARRSDSVDFAELRASAARIRKLRDETSEPLEKDEFLAQWADRRGQSKHLEPPEPGKDIVRDAYLDEVLAIAGDYAHALRARYARV